MRDYGKVSAQFWTGKTGKALRGSPEAQIVALYLMTCPTSEMTGVFQCPMLYIAHETGLGMEGAMKGLQSLIEREFCMYDDDSETVFVFEMARFQIGEELKVNDNQVKAVKKAYSSMKGVIKAEFYERYSIAFHLITESPSEAPSKPRTGTRARARTEAGTSSVPNGTGIPPIAETEKTSEQLTKDELWSAGKSILLQQGMPKEQCGSFVGKLVKDYGNDIVIEAVRAAVVERPADAVSFLKASCMARKNEGGKTLIPWHATDAGVIAKGTELGMSPHPGETMLQFKARLIARIDGKPSATATSNITKQENGGNVYVRPEGAAPLKSLVKIRGHA